MQKGAERSGTDYSNYGIGVGGRLIVTGTLRRKYPPVVKEVPQDLNEVEGGARKTVDEEIARLGSAAVSLNGQPNLEITEGQPGEQQA